jgi:hypothetical protein
MVNEVLLDQDLYFIIISFKPVKHFSGLIVSIGYQPDEMPSIRSDYISFSDTKLYHYEAAF